MKGKLHCASPRRGAIILLTVFLMVVMLGIVAFAVDLGYVVLVKSQLQTATDSAALAAGATMGATTGPSIAAAQEYGAYHKAGGKSVSIATSDIEFGTWDSTTRTFTTSANGNAVRVTGRRNDTTGGNNMFFGRIFGQNSFQTTASAVAMGNPRDIALVVDLSGSMNNDTEPCWATNEITSVYGSTVANSMMQQVFTDMGYGTFPGVSQYVGAPLSVTADQWAYARLTSNTGPLKPAAIPATYRIVNTDSEATRKTKAYRWIIDFQIAVIMPFAKPTPNSATNYNYWERYIDYVMRSVNHNTTVTGVSPNSRGTLPPNQSAYRVDSLDNPSTASYPSASATTVQGFRNQIGYRTYVQFCMDMGRDVRPDGVNYTPLSVNSPDCRYHDEATAGGTFSFPPSEQPTHASRRSLIAAVQEIKTRNTGVPTNQKDWVSIITFDTVSGTVVHQALTGDYDAAMQACRRLQAVSDTQASTATESGLIDASNHLSHVGGAGRISAQKVVVLMTDGIPNLYESSNGTISSYMSAHSNSNFVGNHNPSDAALMQVDMLKAMNWKTFAVGLGLGADYNFLDRVARMGQTSNDSGQAPRTSGDPVAYETELSAIFRQIITNPTVRLVK